MSYSKLGVNNVQSENRMTCLLQGDFVGMRLVLWVDRLELPME